MLYLSPLGVEIFIKRSNSKNMDPHWDNYDLVIWKKNSNGFTNIKGMFRKNSWGIADRVSVDNQGTWKLPKHYVKYFK
jgi:hypothetical protein